MPHPPHPVLAAVGWDPARQDELAGLLDDRLTPGRCIRVDRGRALVLTAAGTLHVPAREPVATGDWLALAPGPRIARVLARRTQVARRPAGRRSAPQVLAANVDLLLVACGLDRPVREGRIRRFCALAAAGGVAAHVVLTKADLHPDPGALAAGLARATGLPVHVASAATGAGLGPVAALAAGGRTLALAGESGAGKSTLIAALSGADRATGAVRPGDAKGRHVTTARELVPLPGGGALVDTPGLREVGLAAEAGLEAAFADIAAVAAGCRFRDCTHEVEPGCAVRAAAEAGLVDPAEVDRMAAMRREARAAELRASTHELRRHARRFARAARAAGRTPRGRA